VIGLEQFPATYHPGYFIIKGSVCLLALLMLVRLVLGRAPSARGQNILGNWVITIQIENNGAGGSQLATAPGEPASVVTVPPGVILRIVALLVSPT